MSDSQHERQEDEYIRPRSPVDEPPTYRARCSCGWVGGQRYRGITDNDWRQHEDAVTTHASYGQPMTMPMGVTCAVHVHREWVPIEAHHVWPKGMGGPDTAANKISVCASGHYAIHEFIRRLILGDGKVPWSIARHFGRKVRAYAIRGWTEAGCPTSGGGGE